MKNVLKILAVLAAVCLLAVVIVLKAWSSRPAAPTNYQRDAETGGAIEAAYMANGSYAVSVYEEPVLQGFSKYTIFYPTELAATAKQYPVIVISNGSGTPLSKYPAVPRHLASWGFIVIGTEEESDWNGFASEMCIRHLRNLHDHATIGERENVFYQKVDLENVGIVGHSQGAVGVYNAITVQANSDIYKAAVALSPTNQELARNLEWEYDLSKIHIPILLMAGAGGGDDWVLTGEQLKDMYAAIDSDKVMARRKNTVHNETLYAANGYVTAWFMWHLQGDDHAKGAFVGEEAEILKNAMYQDQNIHLPNP